MASHHLFCMLVPSIAVLPNARLSRSQTCPLAPRCLAAEMPCRESAAACCVPACSVAFRTAVRRVSSKKAPILELFRRSHRCEMTFFTHSWFQLKHTNSCPFRFIWLADVFMYMCRLIDTQFKNRVSLSLFAVLCFVGSCCQFTANEH